MKLEEEFISYVADQSRTEPMKLPPWDSYHRMLAHRFVCTLHVHILWL